MKTEVYLNTDTNVPSANNFSTTKLDPLTLFPEDRLTITDTFLRHLASCNLTARRMRLALTVFNQTLSFQKLEDDMNGVRLEQLTGIAPNHANSIVRELAQLKVLVVRDGKYGNYLAINFDFSQWGKVNEPVTPTINPCFLLPEEQSDTGLDLSGAVPVDNNDETIETPENVHN